MIMHPRKSIIIVLTLMIPVLLAIPLCGVANAQQPGPESQDNLDGTPDAAAGTPDPVYAEYFLPLEKHGSTPSLKEWDPDKDETVKYYRNIPEYQAPARRTDFFSSNIPKVLGILNYDTVDKQNNKQIGETYYYDRAIFEGWNFIDIYASFGGGVISIPTPQEITLAHKNGLPVIATVGFTDNSSLQYEKDLITKEDGKFWAVDKLTELADTFHFDGWFINTEATQVPGPYLTPAQVLDYSNFAQELSEKKLKNGNNLLVVWYDSLAEDGTTSYPGLNTTSTFIADNFLLNLHEQSGYFLDYQHFQYASDFAEARANVGTRANDVYMGLDWWTGNCPDYLRFSHIQALSDDNKGREAGSRLSLGLWAIPYPTYGDNIPPDPMPKSAEQVHEYVANYWWNPKIIPEELPPIPLNGEGTAMADVVTPKTAITGLPFTITFNLGKGDRYFKNGIQVSGDPWGNLIEQDLLPQYLIQRDGANVDFDFTDALYGGTSLKVENKTAKDYVEYVPIYLTQIENQDPRIGEVRATYKNSGQGNHEFYLKFADGKQEKGQLPPTDGEWKEIKIDVESTHALLEMGMSRIAAGSSVNLGRIQVIGIKTPGSRTWYVAEGSTGGGFDSYLCLQNPGSAPANVELTFSTEEGPMAPVPLLIPETSRLTLRVDDFVPGTWGVSAIVNSDQPIVAERSMYWNKNYSGEMDTPGNPSPSEMRSGHANLGTPAEAISTSALSGYEGSTSYFPEGATAGGFDTWVLLFNPGQGEATAKVSLLTQAGPEVEKDVVVPAMTRVSVHLDELLPSTYDVATEVVSDVPLVCERSMYWDPEAASLPPDMMRGGHSSSGSASASPDWYLTEGSTSGGFDTWLLLQNPEEVEAHAHITFMDQNGVAAEEDFTLLARSRTSVRVADYVADNPQVAASVASDLPIIAERSMYWDARVDGCPDAMRDGHAAVGASTPAGTWMIPEGCTAGGFDSWVLIANVGDTEATATVTLMTGKGAQTPIPFAVAPHTRLSLHLNDFLPGEWQVATLISSDGELVCERSMYWDSRESPGISPSEMMGGHSANGMDP